jgi:predicted Zn finger-like uncharacterized protein
VVVVCESCATRFNVDEARIPPKGTLVRCSRCKATFIVRPPSASFEETVESVVAEITEAGGQPLPEAAEDLFDRPGDDLGATRPRANHDDAWEFDEAPAEKPPPPTLERAAPAPAPRAPAPAAPSEEIGSPADWDLLGDSVASSAREATFVEPAPERVDLGALPTQSLRAPAPAVRAAEPAYTLPARRGSELGSSVVGAARTAVRTTAWLALVALVSFGVAHIVPRGPAPVASSAVSQVIGLPDGEARGVEVRFVENAFAGTLFVVQGELVRTSETPSLGLRIHWVDERGARLGAGEWARALPSARELRERTPEALGSDSAAEARPAPREGAFAAIFEDVPAEATGVALALEPLPQPAAPAFVGPMLPAGENAEAAPGAPPAADPTASSPPSPRPSSE